MVQRRTLGTLLNAIDVSLLNGDVQSISGNKPILLDHSDMSVLVLEGHVDVFAVRLDADGNGGQRQSLFRAATGEMIFGPDRDATYTFLVVGVEGTRVLLNHSEIDPDQFASQHLSAMLDRFSVGLMNSFAPLCPDGEKIVLDPQTRHELYRHTPVFGTSRRPTWVRAADGAELHYFGQTLRSSSILPVTSKAWLEVSDTTQVVTLSSEEIVASGEWRQAMTAFVGVFGANMADMLADQEAEAARRQQARQTAEANVLSATVLEMAQTVRPHRRERTPFTTQHDPLHAAFLLVAQAQDIETALAPKNVMQQDKNASIAALSQTYRVRTRKVMLRDQWWCHDAGPLLAFMEDGNDPVALLPVGRGAYDVVNPRSGYRRRCTSEIADTLKYEAVMLYRPLSEGARTLGGLIRHILPSIRADLRAVGLVGLAGGLLAAFSPIMSAVMIEQVLPRADIELHVHIIIGLVAMAFGGASFEVVKAFALLRVEGRADLHLQSAIFDRVLRLPASFFRRFTAGDLTDRVLGIQTIRQTLSGTTIQSLLGVTFAGFSLVLLVYYNWRLSLVALVLVLIAISVTAVLGRMQLREERVHIAHKGAAEGFVLQLITGLAKLRISAAEGRAYAKWATYFTKQKQRFVTAQSFANWQDIFHALYPVLATAVIFVAASVLLDMQAIDLQLERIARTDPQNVLKPMSAGDFVAFNAAFGQFLAAMTGLAMALTKSLAVIPMFERLQPITNAKPEVTNTDKVAQTLSGQIELSHVSFRYDPDGPLVLDDLSLSIEENEFVAIVGASGSGKSTLVRLLMGFESCEAGDIYFDQTPIGSLDLTSLRQQVRVVMQHGQLTTGSVFTNIAGSSSNLSQEDAWAVARQAGLDKDIEAMPMGMHTVLMEGVNTISGGQRQRLMIARALVHRPRVLLLDEPTSALDNSTQTIVMDSIAHLNATRIVIAHRLSTVRAADRIIVLQNGRVVQEGTYDQLVLSDGPFAEMAQRQLI